jgi:alkylation response protein AidB-like acyl-CoA dehydrogenase
VPISVVASPIAAAGGGSFLIESRATDEVFTPDDLTEEQRQIAATAERFAREEVLPRTAAIEAREQGAMAQLLRKAAELGLTAAEIPEEYGGLELDKVTSALITDHISALASFSTAFGAHTGIGTLPLVWYGTEDQKRRYLPRLATGELIAAYGLSEASSGSDAMNIRTRAMLSDDGTHYVLNGEKHWITNAGIAGLYTVFAKIADGEAGAEKFTAFLIERGTPGLTIGNEEHKMGIRGSSTCPLVLQDCKVPMENLLGEAGKGHHIAFNVLNVGRLKLGVACIGGARHAVAQMIRYAKERKAFGKAIAEFGLVQRKISAAATRLYAAESMAYRTAGLIDARLTALKTARNEGEAKETVDVARSIEEYAVECSILKVYGSEMISFVADELVAAMGGVGYVEDYPAERTYRDARINRIFEGTNEINRLIITGWMMKRAMSGKLPLLAAIKRVMEEVVDPPSFDGAGGASEALAREAAALASMRKMALFAAGVASQRFVIGFEEQQEIMADLADLISHIYALESALLRAQKLARAGRATADVAAAMTGLLAEESLASAEQATRRVLAACAEGDELQTQLAILRRLARAIPADSVALSRAVAKKCIEMERYPV